MEGDWQFTDYVTPKLVAVVFLLGLFGWLLTLLLKKTGHAPPSLDAWGLFIDLVAILSLLITLAILTDVDDIDKSIERIENKYLFRATAPDLQNRLKKMADRLAEQLREKAETDKSKLEEISSRADAILNRIEELIHHDEVRSHVRSLRTTIENYRGRQETTIEDYYDVLNDLRTTEEHLETLVNRSRKTVNQ